VRENGATHRIRHYDTLAVSKPQANAAYTETIRLMQLTIAYAMANKGSACGSRLSSLWLCSRRAKKGCEAVMSVSVWGRNEAVQEQQTYQRHPSGTSSTPVSPAVRAFAVEPRI